ncbi:fructose bisphosphate aldolase [Catenulispora sp. EB89]|uniref:fructose bisphosphate aldolase n=1 Tax=Catenulispora sp. EB89 TaxID=3156257 RepID=UPI00351390BC
MDTAQFAVIRSTPGFFAALDQSGGSTPKALAEYGVAPDRYTNDAEMYDLVHAMRTRIVTNPAFDGTRVLAAILFEQTMTRAVDGLPTGQYLWEKKHVVPFLKVDKGLSDSEHGVRLMKPIDGVDDTLAEANRHGMFGTKMRSVIDDANPAGIQSIVDQQFDLAARIAAAGLVPIIEPEVSIASPRKAEAEELLREALERGVAAWRADTPVMLKLTIPTRVALYADLAADPRVLRVLALSGGYSRTEACELLARDPSMIASFSRALLEGLREDQSERDFTARLDASIAEIYRASTVKQPAT